MSTNHTANYQLCQWEPGDAVLRADFNADNAKIDASLHNLNTSLGALETALRGKQSSLQMLQRSNGNGQSLGVTLSLPKNERWDEWGTVCALVSYPNLPADVTLSVDFLESGSTTLQAIKPLGAPGYLMVFFPVAAPPLTSGALLSPTG